jgi:hypothetical protein
MITRILTIGLLLFLAGCDAPPPQGMSCGWSAGLFNRECFVEPGASFRGLSVGMPSRKAFYVLCSPVWTAQIEHFLVYVPDATKIGQKGHGWVRSVRPPRCSDWR